MNIEIKELPRGERRGMIHALGQVNIAQVLGRDARSLHSLYQAAVRFRQGGWYVDVGQMAFNARGGTWSGHYWTYTYGLFATREQAVAHLESLPGYYDCMKDLVELRESRSANRAQ